ncbi:MmgE/PrpD family protein [Hoeflea sp. CAU 1731]
MNQMVSSELASFAASVHRDSISKIGYERARTATLDCLACILAGSNSEPAKSVQGGIRISGGSGDVPVLGTGLRFSAPLAALANGTAAHALDFDDNFLPGITHASAVIVPALISASQLKEVSVGDYLAAYCVGLEMQARIGRLVQPQHYASGWHSTSTIGTIGAAAAVAKLMELPSEKILSSMSIASSMAAGSKLQFGKTLKPAHAGIAAHNSVIAACLAAQGLEGQSEFINGKWGFSELYNGNGGRLGAVPRRCDGENQWAIVTDGLWMKRFPCCAASHKALDCILDLKEQTSFGLDDVVSATVWLPPTLAENLRFDLPRDANEARFSFSYPAAKLIENGVLNLSDFDDRKVRSTEIRRHLNKFKRSFATEAETALDGRVRVELRLISGETLARETNTVKGSPGNEFDVATFQRKINDCLSFGRTRSYAKWVSSFSLLEPDACFSTWCKQAHGYQNAA